MSVDLALVETWREGARRCATGEATLSALFGDEGCVRMALHAPGEGLSLLTLPCPAGVFPSVAAEHPPAGRLERAIADLYGYRALGAPDPRAWLDHGVWPVTAPLGAAASGTEAEPYRFLAAEGPGLHQIPVGPVHAGIIEPGHFRFHASGETVVRLEARLGYTHKGVESLMRGASLERAASLAGRISGDSAVAYQIAFARAVEAALHVEAPRRAAWLRATMAELERLANHFGDIGAICNDASFALMHAHCGVLRERALRATEAAFGRRVLMDAIAPGGVSVDLAPGGAEAIAAFVKEARRAFPPLVELYDNTASLQDRTVGTGRLGADLARQWGAGGYVGRASGRAFDARRATPYAPYDTLNFEIPVRSEGDVNARVWLRIDEALQSLAMLEQMLVSLPEGEIRTVTPAAREGEGMALVEGFRGDVFAYVRLDAEGRVARAHLRDPSWFHWPLLEAAIEGNIVADFPLCNKSFNGSYSGCDL